VELRQYSIERQFSLSKLKRKKIIMTTNKFMFVDEKGKPIKDLWSWICLNGNNKKTKNKKLMTIKKIGKK
jgi:hypothetical protein